MTHSIFLKVVDDGRRGGPFPPAMTDIIRACMKITFTAGEMGITPDDLILEMVDWQVLRVDLPDEHKAALMRLMLPYPTAFTL